MIELNLRINLTGNMRVIAEHGEKVVEVVADEISEAINRLSIERLEGYHGYEYSHDYLNYKCVL